MPFIVHAKLALMTRTHLSPNTPYSVLYYSSVVVVVVAGRHHDGSANRHCSEVRAVEEEAHQAATNQPGNGDGHDPRQGEEADTRPVDRLQAVAAETDTDRGTRDAHGRQDGEGVLEQDEDRGGGTHLHQRVPLDKRYMILLPMTLQGVGVVGRTCTGAPTLTDRATYPS